LKEKKSIIDPLRRYPPHQPWRPRGHPTSNHWSHGQNS